MSEETTGVLNDLVQVSERSIEERVRDFSDLLKDIDTLDDKKRQLWKEIYENAIADRQNAYVMFTKLVRICGNDSTQHAVHGKTVATYIERMSRSNEQLLKLVDLIAAEKAASDKINPDEMFEKINSKRGR